MIRVCKVCAYVTGAAIILVMLMASKPVEEQGFTPRPKLPPNAGAVEKAQDRDRPVIPRLSSFKGDIFDGFVELRLQDIIVDEFGVVSFSGEPFEALVNIDYITMVHRYEDFKETDYSCMIYFKDKEIPFLVRQQYKEVLSSIRRASGK
jgi:hypothetical protein